MRRPSKKSWIGAVSAILLLCIFLTPALGTLRTQALETLPDDASFTDIVECVEFVNAVLEGIADADQGRLIPHEEVMRRVRQWPR